MSKRTGLGRGLGAFFGDDYEAPAKRVRTSNSQQESTENTESETTEVKTTEAKTTELESTEAETTVVNNRSNTDPIAADTQGTNQSPSVVGAFEGEMKENDEKAGKKERSDNEGNRLTEHAQTGTAQNDRRHNLEELDMILPSSSRKKVESKTVKGQKTGTKSAGKVSGKSGVGKTSAAKAGTVKTVETVKIVEVEKEKFLNISLIEPNREQPRKDFDEEQLNELADSIKAYGVLQPLLVQKKGEYYEIIAGERRWRAAKLAGLREVPVVVREYSKQESMEIALIENVQRADLNPIEEARAYQMLVQEFGLKQEEVASRVSKNRATITNSMRLLKLDERVQELLIQNQISGGHARALLGLEDHEQQFQIAGKIAANQLSVREVEKLVKILTKPQKEKKEPEEEERDLSIFYQDLEEKLKSVMGTKVIINKKDKNKGRIEIEYYSPAELERIAELLQSIQI